MSNSPDAKPSPLSAPESTHMPPDRELPVSSPVDDAGAPATHPAAAADQNDSFATSGTPVDAESATPPAEGELTEDQVKIALRRVKDPELNLNILDLGLVYEIRVNGNDVSIDMSLTSPGCPSGPEIMSDAERHLRAIPGVGDVAVNLVWSPFWSPDRIEPRVRAYLGF
jgi:metal-sulfur cluster biosynthetic enzyme